MVQRIPVVVLTAFALWLTSLWIDSFLRPSQYTWSPNDVDFGAEVPRVQLNLRYSPQRIIDRTFMVLIVTNVEQSQSDSSNEKIRPYKLMGCKFAAMSGMLGLSVPAFYVLPIVWLYPFTKFCRGPLRHFRRRRRGLCLKCGYDLTGVPEPRCPECGLQHDYRNGIPSGR